MFIVYVAERRLAKYVKFHGFYNGFRSVVVWFVFRFGGSPSGPPVVGNIKNNRFYKLFVDTAGRRLAVHWVLVWRVPGPVLRFEITSNNDSFLNVFKVFDVICSSLGLETHPRGRVCKQMKKRKDL